MPMSFRSHRCLPSYIKTGHAFCYIFLLKALMALIQNLFFARKKNTYHNIFYKIVNFTVVKMQRCIGVVLVFTVPDHCLSFTRRHDKRTSLRRALCKTCNFLTHYPNGTNEQPLLGVSDQVLHIHVPCCKVTDDG